MSLIEDSGEKAQLKTTCCPYDCGGRCMLRVHISNGKIQSIGTDHRLGSKLKACPRGFAQKEVVYAPDRLTMPLKRVGERGSGKFEPIPWNEALETVARELNRIKKRYGTNAIFLMNHYGSEGALHGTRKTANRFFSMFGGCMSYWSNISLEAAEFASQVTLGTSYTGNSRDNLLFSNLIILWGWNPVVTRFGPDTLYYLTSAKKAGTKIICVAPRFSQSARSYAEQWVPIRPGTDAALLIAMAHVMIEEDLYDRTFIDTHSVGFGQFKDYVLGREDGQRKTPAWAEGITGVPASTAEQLARDYATLKPGALWAS